MVPIGARLRSGLIACSKLPAQSPPRSFITSAKMRKMTSQTRALVSTAQSEKLWTGIAQKYEKAQAAQAATITDTSTEILIEFDIPFILKVATVLRDKPKGPKTGDSKAKKEWRNPFLPPDPDLYICDISSSHSLVLNKFNIVPHHALVITRDFIPQEDPLTAPDFEATWQVMLAMPNGGGLAYFNRGPLSGASQPHKHLQIVPLPLNPSPKYQFHDPPLWPLIEEATKGKRFGVDGAYQMPSLPFANFVTRLDPLTTTSEILAATHTHLVELANSAVEAYSNGQPPAVLSYNTVMTREFMLVVPRREESIGPISCNAMAFAGSFFVRGIDELEYIREQGPMKILSAVGYPPL